MVKKVSSCARAGCPAAETRTCGAVSVAPNEVVVSATIGESQTAGVLPASAAGMTTRTLPRVGAVAAVLTTLVTGCASATLGDSGRALKTDIRKPHATS